MKIRLECDCGASQSAIIKGNADEATVIATACWIRSHSLHGERLVGRKNIYQPDVTECDRCKDLGLVFRTVESDWVTCPKCWGRSKGGYNQNTPREG